MIMYTYVSVFVTCIPCVLQIFFGEGEQNKVNVSTFPA